jgi:hypothetical protein
MLDPALLSKYFSDSPLRLGRTPAIRRLFFIIELPEPRAADQVLPVRVEAISVKHGLLAALARGEFSGLIFEEGELILASLLFVYVCGFESRRPDQLIRYEIADSVFVKPAIRGRFRFGAGCSTEPN